TIAGTPTRVYLDMRLGTAAGSSTVLELHDDGTNGDRKGGDGIYSALLPTTSIVQAMTADDVQRVFIGFLTVTNGASTVLRGNIFATIYSPDLGTPLITPISPTFQMTSRVVNMWDPNYVKDLNGYRVVQQFYRLFGDDYDFFNLISV